MRMRPYESRVGGMMRSGRIIIVGSRLSVDQRLLVIGFVCGQVHVPALGFRQRGRDLRPLISSGDRVVDALSGFGVDAVVERVDEERSEVHMVRLGDALAVAQRERRIKTSTNIPIVFTHSAFTGEILNREAALLLKICAVFCNALSFAGYIIFC